MGHRYATRSLARGGRATDGVRHLCCTIAAVLSAGCTTTSYTSQKPAAVVADCIAAGWRHVSGSAVELPVSLTRAPDHYFVDGVLVRDFPTQQPIHSIWAKVRPDSPDDLGGSSTEYGRNFQIAHERIDRVVQECQ